MYSRVKCFGRIAYAESLLLQQVMHQLLLIARPSTPPVPCCLFGYACCPVPGVQFTEDAPRTVLHAGLHHSCCIHQGGCNLIPFGSAREEEEGTALRSDALSSAPPLSLPSPLSFLPHLFYSPVRRGRSVAHTPPGPSYRIVHPPNKPRLGRHYAAEFLVFTLVFFHPTNAFTGGIVRMHARPVTCPSMYTSGTDLPESTLPSLRRRGLSSAHS